MNALACFELVELASDYVDGVLDGSTHALVSDHLAGCWACANYVGELRATIRLVADLPSEHLPGSLESSLLSRYRDWVASSAAA